MKNPECCDRETFISWLGSFYINETPTIAKFCSDCTREYQREMKLQDRCENPEFRPEEP